MQATNQKRQIPSEPLLLGLLSHAGRQLSYDQTGCFASDSMATWSAPAIDQAHLCSWSSLIHCSWKLENSVLGRESSKGCSNIDEIGPVLTEFNWMLETSENQN